MLLCSLTISVFLSSLLSGCPSYTAVPEHQRVEIAAAHLGETRWLKQSMYAGTFYDDDRFELVSAQPFEQITVLRSLDGEVIPPPPAQEILPAGTRVRIERVAFPSAREVFRRPLYTPRYTTWVIMRVAASRGDTRLERARRHILLLPTFLSDEEEFDLWLDASLTATDPNPWLQTLSPSVRRGIFDKKASLGMSYDALTSALGYPDRITRTRRVTTKKRGPKNITVEVAIYGATSVVLEDGIVIRVSNPATGETLATEADDANADGEDEPPKKDSPLPVASDDSVTIPVVSPTRPKTEAPPEATKVLPSPEEAAAKESGDTAADAPSEMQPADSKDSTAKESHDDSDAPSGEVGTDSTTQDLR